MLTFVVNESDASHRLDYICARKMPELTRSYINKLCDEGKVLVNDKAKKPSYKLKHNDKIIITINLEELRTAPEIKIPIIYEDDDCLVINKPEGILSHSKGALNPEATVATFIKDKILITDDNNRAGIVHRLDRPTSGVMICAKTTAAQKYLQKQFAKRNVKKTYAAIVEGTPKEPTALIEMPIARNPKSPKTFRVHSGGKPAATHYQTVKSKNGYSLLKLQPVTGRTHQLRVHLQHIGHPIVGDELYGGAKSTRLLLHALELDIVLFNGQHKIFTTELPIEFNL